jgi:sterol desaturase/sphingolipid hydroxylase (fatty acid hydroxylase superfamily)
MDCCSWVELKPVNSTLVGIFSLVCGIAGWFYLFYSSAAGKLAGVEAWHRNRLRVGLRRVCGAALFLLGGACFAGYNAVDDRRSPEVYLAVWLGVMFLLLVIIVLVGADIWFTWKLRHSGGKDREGL